MTGQFGTDVVKAMDSGSDEFALSVQTQCGYGSCHSWSASCQGKSHPHTQCARCKSLRYVTSPPCAFCKSLRSVSCQLCDFFLSASRVDQIISQAWWSNQSWKSEFNGVPKTQINSATPTQRPKSYSANMHAGRIY